MINHTEQQFASEIKQAFIQIPVPDKFNDHNLSVRVVNLNEKLSGAKSEKENREITEFLDKNKIASRLVGRWFNRDIYTGACDQLTQGFGDGLEGNKQCQHDGGFGDPTDFLVHNSDLFLIIPG